MSKPLEIKFPTFGWEQMLTARQKMLDEFDRARKQSRAHEVETYHGNVAEAAVRAWLSDFLPKRYGVTSGYIVSPGLPPSSKAPHYDVIIYDQLESPVLWIEEHAGTTPLGRSLAIPVEYVKSVIEVKSALTARTLSDAIAHLRDLAPLMSSTDSPDAPFRLQLPPEFSCFPLFFELRAAEATRPSLLDGYLTGRDLRGFDGGIILRAEGHDGPYTGHIQYAVGDEPMPTTPKSKNLSYDTHFSDAVEWKGRYLMAFSGWYEAAFSRFAFDLIARMQGRYAPSRLSSFYGMGTNLKLD